MEELYYEGKIRVIGVSNYKVHHIEDLLKVATVIPAVNQVGYILITTTSFTGLLHGESLPRLSLTISPRKSV